MKHTNYLTLLLLALFCISLASCSDEDENKLNSGISNQSWTEGQALEIGEDNELTVSFHAAAKWVASVISGADWCKLNTTSGEKGQNSLTISVETSSATDRTAKISINIDGYSPAIFEVIQKGSGSTPSAEDMEVNEQVNLYLSEMYLWNDEYKTLDLDFTQSYDNFFYGALGSMTTNTLDKKPDGYGGYTLFSYIEKKNVITKTLATTQVEKELEYSFGITGVVAVGIDNKGHYAFCVQGVYPDSPATGAGIKRGTYISEVNGNPISESNYTSLFYDLMLPASALSLDLTELVIHEDNTTHKEELSLTAQAMYKNPVLYQDVIQTDNGHKIGYLVYAGFDAGYDDLLFDAFKNFKSKGVEDLVLDLRYNGGGHVISANLIASCIAGSSSQGKVFVKYRYNEDRMKKLGGKKPEEPFSYDYYANLQSPLSAGGLNLPRVYCLVGSGTASASELVINSLRGIGIDVVLIGEKTTGKNVGMEVANILAKENTYQVAPITFQSYNAQDYGDYENGFTPDIPLNENDADNDGYFDDYADYGDRNEPLLSRAIQEITGQSVPQSRSLIRKAARGKVLPMPAIHRPGHEGMIKKYEPAE